MRMLSFAIIGVLFACCSTDNWTTHREKINVGFTIEYRIPTNLYSNRIENGMCIGPEAKSEGQKMRLVESAWCMWMTNSEQESLDSDISYFKTQAKGQVKETRSRIKVAGVVAQRVTIDGTNGYYKEIIYFTKFKTIFVINNSIRDDQGFRKFYSSLRIFK